MSSEYYTEKLNNLCIILGRGSDLTRCSDDLTTSVCMAGRSENMKNPSRVIGINEISLLCSQDISDNL